MPPGGDGVMRGHGLRADPHRRLPQGAQVVVFSALVHFHVPGRARRRAAMARVRVHLLQEGAGPRAK